jgi:membrane protease YdiL (CAAX protease family)
MIFRIKLRWWASMLATSVLLGVAWPLGGAGPLAGRFESAYTAACLGVAAGFGCMVVNFLIDRVLRLALASYAREFNTYAIDVVRRMGFADAVAGGLMAGVGEEPFFRGVLVGCFEQPAVGVVAAAFVFGAMHHLRWRYISFSIWGVGEGLIFGTLYVTTGSILVPAIAHGMFDTVGFLYFERLRDHRGQEAPQDSHRVSQEPPGTSARG